MYSSSTPIIWTPMVANVAKYVPIFEEKIEIFIPARMVPISKLISAPLLDVVR